MARPLEEVLTELSALMPKCSKGMQGPCYEPSDSSRGFAVYDSGEQICMSDILLPGFNLLPRWLLGGIYLVFLLYLFAGVALASDMFMDGIMEITAIMKTVKRKNERGEVVEVKEPVWNWVVANISLMALGTSAPEIMLSLVEALITLGKPAGELGPSTIVGSAAYNFLIISAVCTTALPDGQFKRISQLRVYITTCIWSLWAYLWMLVVYRWWTPDEVTIVEGLLTLCFFFLLIFNAWLIDTQPWKKRPPVSMTEVVEVSPAAAGADVEMQCTGGSMRSGSTKASQLPGSALMSPQTRAFFEHIIALRQRNSAKRFGAKHESDPHGGKVAPIPDSMAVVKLNPNVQQVMFRSPAYSVLESAGMAKVAVIRVPAAGKSLTAPLRVFYKTEDGDAVAGLDYEAAEGVLHFASGEDHKYINVKILDDDQSEPDVTFSIVLCSLETPAGVEAVIAQARVQVTIVDDDDAGLLGFELPDYEIGYNDGKMYAEVTVVRRRGADGMVEVEYETEDDCAVASKDYVASKGKIVFESGQKSSKLRVQLLPYGLPEAHKAFRVVLKNPTGGAELSNRHSCRVTIVRRELTLVKAEADGHARVAVAETPVGSASTGSFKAGGEEEFNIWVAWRQQIKGAFEVDDDDDDDDDGSDDAGAEGASGSSSNSGGDSEERSWGTLILHYVNFSWRVILSVMVPPAEWKGGYPCFLASLGSIVGLVYLVNETGTLFGCIVGLKDIMTGISIVALGTSVPDTMASRIAAIKDSTADAAIGNITGSNSVNVFLGLGLPWTICSIYYRAKGEKYVTPAGDLSFAVMLYAIIGGCGIVILALCRRYGGELGGSKARQWSIAGTLASLWILYLILSGLRAYGSIDGI